jgi:hypothetical protein
MTGEEIVLELDVGLFVGGLSLTVLGVLLAAGSDANAAVPAVGLALAATGGTLTPTGNLVTVWAGQDLHRFANLVFAFSAVGVLLLAGSALYWAFAGGGLAELPSGTGPILIGLGATLIPIGAQPPVQPLVQVPAAELDISAG